MLAFSAPLRGINPGALKAASRPAENAKGRWLETTSSGLNSHRDGLMAGVGVLCFSLPAVATPNLGRHFFNPCHSDPSLFQNPGIYGERTSSGAEGCDRGRGRTP